MCELQMQGNNNAGLFILLKCQTIQKVIENTVLSVPGAGLEPVRPCGH